MTESLNEADHELRSLLRFAAGLGVDDATVFEIYAVVREERQEADVTTEERLAEARRRLVVAAGQGVITWRRTFADAHHDFVAERDGLTLGRIYRHRPGGLENEVWFWTASGLLPRAEDIGKVSGEEQTREEAIGALRDAVERARAWGERTGKPYVQPNPPRWLRS